MPAGSDPLESRDPEVAAEPGWTESAPEPDPDASGATVFMPARTVAAEDADEQPAAASGHDEPPAEGPEPEDTTADQPDRGPESVEQTVVANAADPGVAETQFVLPVADVFGPPSPLDEEPPEESSDPAVLRLVAELEDEVVVIDEQPRYHAPDCDGVQAQPVIPLPVREAVELGFTPCAWCTPNRKLASQHPAAARAERRPSHPAGYPLDRQRYPGPHRHRSGHHRGASGRNAVGGDAGRRVEPDGSGPSPPSNERSPARSATSGVVPRRRHDGVVPVQAEQNRRRTRSPPP